MVETLSPRKEAFSGNSGKGQAALEYMIIVSIALVMITPLIANSQQTVDSISQTRQTTMLSEAMDSIEKGARLVRSQGEPAKITMNVELPDNIVRSNVTGDYIHYRMRVGTSESDYFRFMKFDVEGELPVSKGVHEIVLSSEEDGVRIGYR